MPETIYTPDGKLHTLLGSTTLAAIVREYAGDEAGRRVEELERGAKVAEYLIGTDLQSYEASLEHWHDQAQDWIDTINATLKKADDSPRSAKKILTDTMKDLRRRIYKEL